MNTPNKHMYILISQKWTLLSLILKALTGSY